MLQLDGGVVAQVRVGFAVAPWLQWRSQATVSG